MKRLRPEARRQIVHGEVKHLERDWLCRIYRILARCETLAAATVAGMLIDEIYGPSPAPPLPGGYAIWLALAVEKTRRRRWSVRYSARWLAYRLLTSSLTSSSGKTADVGSPRSPARD